MAVQASVNTPIFFKRHTPCEKNTWNSKVRKPVSSYKACGDDVDDDNVPLSARLSRMSNLGTCRSKCDDSVKKRHTTLPLKRPLDNNNSLQISVKQSKVSVSLYDDNVNGDNIPISWRIKRSCISADKSFPAVKKFVEKELALVEKSIEGCQKKRLVEEQRLHSLKRDTEKCSKEFGNKKMQVSCVRRIDEVHRKMQSKIEECVKDLVAKEAQLYLMEDLIGERKQELKTKEIELRRVDDNINKDRKRKEEELKILSQKVAECTKELNTKEKELDAMKKLISGQAKELESERKKLLKVMSIRRTDPRSQMKDFESMKNQFEGRVKELESKEIHFEERVKELKSKEKQLESQVKEIESKKEEFEGQIKDLKSEKKHIESRVKELTSKEKQLEGQVKQFKSKKEELEGQVKAFKSKKEELEGQMKELESQKKQFEGRVKEVKSKEKQLESRSKEFESKEEEFKGQVKELESKNKHFENRVKELESKETQLEGRLKEFKSKEEEFNGQVKVVKSKRKRLKSRVKKLKSIEKKVEGRVSEIESKEKQLEGRAKELQSREEEFESLMKELKSNKKHFESQAEDFKSEEEQFEGRGKELHSIENKLEVQAKELKSKEEQFEGQVNDLESKPNNFDGHLKDLELKEKQHEALLKSLEEDKESVTSYTDNQSSPTIDGRSLQFLPNDQTDELESLGNDILVNLLASSDPSKVVLDIIQNPIIPQCREGNSAVIIDGNHIILLKQLMRISPAIKPHVREEALKLALDLKANMSESTENSLVVLGFLLLASIYGLVPSFDEDEVFKLFGFAAQHKVAVELFGTMGFADKISDFVQNLIGKQQYIEAVRFICAYNLVDKYQIVDLL